MGLLRFLRPARSAVAPAAATSRFDDARRAARLFGDPSLPVPIRPSSLLERIGLSLRVRLAGSVQERVPADMRAQLTRLGDATPVDPPSGARRSVRRS